MSKHQMPARGAMDGMRQDMQKAKSDTTYNPNGVGNAYSHNFLNQKPWHPANFKNQARVYEAEQKQIQEAKQKEIAKAEFAAEQDFLKTLSYLSPEEQQKFKERQGVQFLYMKPPGADSMPAGPAKVQLEDPATQPSGDGNAPAADQIRPLARPQTGHVSNMLGAMRALQNHDRWHVKHVAGMGRSPPRGGGADKVAANQQLLVSSSEDEVQEADATEKGGRSITSAEERVAEAEAVLRQAGYDIEKLKGLKSRKRKKRKVKKHGRVSKQQRQ